jgi:hypothetical protein
MRMPKKHNRYTKEFLEPVVKESGSWGDVCERCGVKRGFGAENYLRNVAIKFEIDYSHFKGQGWARNLIFDKKPLEKFLVLQSKITRSELRRRLIRDGYKKAQCEKCGLTEWLGEPIGLELHHTNQIPDDNRIENLLVLCANCHTVADRIARRQRKFESG